MTDVLGRLVLADRVVGGRLRIEDGTIVAVDLDDGVTGPFLAPGFADLHVHGFGGGDAMGSVDDLDRMARSLLRRGVTSFLPTAVTADIHALAGFADRVRRWIPGAPPDGATPLGFGLEGPFLSPARCGVHDPRWLRVPDETSAADLDPLLPDLRLITIAPELPGALRLIEWLSVAGIVVSLGHSAATLEEARAGYAAGGRSTTHLFNAMSGVHHREPGLAVAALTDDAVAVELIADGHHVDRAVWPIITRTKPRDRLVLVSDAIPDAGTDATQGTLGGRRVEIRDGRAILAGTETIAGSVIALDDAVRNLVATGVPLADAVAAASTNPLTLLGIADRGRIAPGQIADLVELDDGFRVRRVMRSGRWIDAAVRTVRVYCAVQPPSIVRTEPVTIPACSEARYRTAAPISSRRPTRPTGIRSRTPARKTGSSSRSAVPGV